MAGRDDGDDVIFCGSDSPFRRERPMVLGGGVLKGEGDRDKIGGEVRGGLVIEEKMRDRVRERGEKGNDRLVGRNVRRGSAVFEGDEVDVPEVGHHQDVLVAVV